MAQKLSHSFSKEEMDLFAVRVFTMWEEHCDGMVDVFERDGKTMCALRTREDDYIYDSIAEALADVLYTIGEWIKEG